MKTLDTASGADAPPSRPPKRGMTVSRRLQLLLGIALLGMIGIGAVGLLAMDKVRDSASYATVNSVPSYEVLDDTFQGLVDAMADVAQHVLSADSARKAALEQRFAARWPRILATLNKYEPLLSDEHDRQLLATDRALLAEYDAQRGRIFAASNAARSEEARDLLQASLATVDRITDAFQAHRQYNHALAEAGEQEARRIHGQASWLIVGITLLAIALSSAAALVIIRTLLRQLGGEPEYAAEIAGRIAAGDLEVRIATQADDRGSLLVAMQEMRDKLRETQAELVTTAHQAGMAEIATNVLHNVGNVLNSFNISADVVSNQIRTSKLEGLARAVQMLDEHAADLGDFLSHDEKGQRLPGYLAKLAEALAAEQRNILAELGQMSKSIEHIKDIVATQQSYAGASRLIEPVCIHDLVEDALRMNAGALARHEVTVVKEFAEVPPLPLDRHRLLQILVNLISNAKYAMSTVADAHRLTLRIDLVDGADGRRLRIGVADEGEGIAPENMARIFTHGFTTRQEGHGFGLHSCVVAAQEMGGSLTAHSDGPGRGANFILELPLEQQRARHETLAARVDTTGRRTDDTK